MYGRWRRLLLVLLAAAVCGSAAVLMRGRPTDSALADAVLHGDAGVVETRLARGADPNATDKSGEPSICLAARTPVTAVIHGMGTNGVDQTIEKHLGYAAIVRSLVEHGARSDVRDGAGCTPLQRAQQFEEMGTVELLKRVGAGK